MIIGISGRAGSGKDLTAEYLKYWLECHPKYGKHTWQIKKFAYKLKQLCAIITGLTPEDFENREVKETYSDKWGMTFRELLQRVGTEAMRNVIHKDVWVKALFSEYSNDDHWIISDLRMPNEYEVIKALGGIVIRVYRGPQETGKVHISETALDDYNFDIVINNSYTKESLNSKIMRIVTEWKMEGIK
jgi:hypothetical protein